MIAARLVLWDLLHNCLAHPLRSITCYSQLSQDFHEFTRCKIEDAKVDAYFRRPAAERLHQRLQKRWAALRASK